VIIGEFDTPEKALVAMNLALTDDINGAIEAC
jgi:hypothetical protein